jgi:hypothetical protein
MAVFIPFPGTDEPEDALTYGRKMMEDSMCYWRAGEAEETKRTQQQANEKQVQARRNERVNELLTEAQKQANKTVPDRSSVQELVSSK